MAADSPDATPGRGYDDCVFINCPFDDKYRPLFEAAVFTVLECGFTARSALEITDSGQPRIHRIGSIIGECRWGIHDISRVELNEAGLPRFNMPLELGIFLGARRFGNRGQRRKSALILDHDQFRYQSFISDIAGQDITPHGSDPNRMIAAVRNWLSDSKPRNTTPIPGGDEIARRFARFETDLPAMCATLHLNPETITFSDRTWIISYWARRARSAGD